MKNNDSKMNTTRHSECPPRHPQRSEVSRTLVRNDNTISWLKNGVWALGLAGLYSIVLVVLRTPQLAYLLEDKSLFKSSLIIHVDLSVVVWMFSITCVIWSIGRRYYFESIFSKLAFLGMVLMAISPLLESSRPVMNNYVPILENIWFIIGLSLFGGVALCFAVVVIPSVGKDLLGSPKEFGMTAEVHRLTAGGGMILPIIKLTTALMYIMVWICFALSYRDLVALLNIFPIDIDYYYELLFWSGGHLMQFIYTQVVMFVWLILAQAWVSKKLSYYSIYAKIFMINFAMSGLIFYGHFAYEMSQYEFTAFFTKHMQYTGGIGPLLFILVLGVDIWRNCYPQAPTLHPQRREGSQEAGVMPHEILRRAQDEGSCAEDDAPPGFVCTAFVASTFLFFVGGLIGILISGINVSIPAHYHGSIVGISIAFLGLAYVICFNCHLSLRESPRALGASDEEKSGSIRAYIPQDDGSRAWDNNKGNTLNKWANIQLYLITIGQLLHISGLALAGGYGIMRKSPDGVIATSAKVYMGMMGGGGLIAIIGGLMFVYICGRRLKCHSRVGGNLK